MLRRTLKTVKIAAPVRASLAAVVPSFAPKRSITFTAAPIVAPARAVTASTLLRPTPVVAVSPRSMSFISGLKDKVTASVDSKKDQLQQNAFADSLKKIVDLGDLTMDRYLEMQREAASQSSGWKAKAAAMVGQKVDTEVIDRSVKVFEALTPAERASFKRSSAVPFMTKQRIAVVTKFTAEEINIQLRKYDELAMIAKWLKKRVTKKLPLPESPEQMQRMMREDPPEVPDSLKPKARRR